MTANFKVLSPTFGLKPIVIKIGGSVLRQASAIPAIRDAFTAAARPIVVVTGGGVFADTVRDAQKEIGFDDLAAHRMAILAMHQNAMLLASLINGFELVSTRDDVGAALQAGQRLIWLPLDDCENDPELPPNWETTSDAIAVRLAEQLGGLPICFVKSRSAADLDAQGLADDGLIDATSARLLIASKLPFSVVSASKMDDLRKLLAEGDDIDAPSST